MTFGMTRAVTRPITRAITSAIAAAANAVIAANVNALSFNGTTSIISCGNGASLQNLHDGAMTVEGWISPTSLGENLAGRLFDSNAKWLFYVRTQAPTSGIQIAAIIDCATTDAQCTSTTGLVAGGWYHVAMTWDDASYTTPRLWVNGKEEALLNTSSRSGAVVANASDVLSFGNRAAADRTFDGKTGWMRISNIVRYTGTFTTPDRFSPPTVDANTVLQYNMTEGSGTTLDDASANNNDGTLTSTTWTTQSEGEYSSVYVATKATDTTVAKTAARVPHQRSCFYAQGRYWLVYADYTTPAGPQALSFISSTDGVTWETPAAFGTSPCYDAQWSVDYDETNNRLFFARNTQTNNNPPTFPFHDGLSYRMGTPNSDGTITWAAALQTAIATGNAVGDFSTGVDSSGYFWVAYGDNDSVDAGTKGNAKVIKNSALDGTWTTAAGFPATIWAGSLNDAFAILAPLTGGSMYAAVYEWANDLQARGYTISGSGTVTLDSATITDVAVEASSGTGAQVGRIEVAGKGDGVVHLVYQSSAQEIWYKSRSPAGSWSAETKLSDNTRVTDAISSPRLSFGPSNIYVLWSATNKYYVAKWNGTVWATPVIVRSITSENTYEHCMPALKANGTTLQLVHLTNDYQLLHNFIEFFT